jgi:hypothetical protein
VEIKLPENFLLIKRSDIDSTAFYNVEGRHDKPDCITSNCVFFYILPLIPYSYGVDVLFILWIYTQSVGLLGQVIGPSQGLFLNTGQHKHRINTHQTSIREVGFEPTITASERTKTVHASDRSASVRASEDSSCPRPLGYRDRLASERAKTVHA